MGIQSLVANAFGMTDEAWRRHANPWSVWTRFAAILALILAVWSRVWLGWWTLVPVAVVIVWLLLDRMGLLYEQWHRAQDGAT